MRIGSRHLPACPPTAASRRDPMLRVVAGTRGSRLIDTPPGRSTRPTSDRVREALFSMLGEVTGLSVLDLFAGSGALGIEALSRGAASAVFVESAGAAARCIRGNLDSLDLADQAELIQADWLRAAKILGERDERFDLVLADPPYSDADSVAARLGQALSPCLAERATVVFESGPDAALVEGMRLEREKHYGDTVVRLYGFH